MNGDLAFCTKGEWPKVERRLNYAINQVFMNFILFGKANLSLFD